MSYSTISQCRSDGAFYNRVLAAVAQEQKARDIPVQPESLVNSMVWEVATASDVETAYEYALNAGTPDPGGDPTVITDGMILANVQANWPS